MNVSQWQLRPGMLTRPAGHEAEARKSEAKDEAQAQKFFEAEAKHIREQLSVYEQLSMNTKILAFRT